MAMAFMSPSPMELMVIAVIALIVLGPSRLPEAARSVGKGMREMRESFQGRDDEEDEGGGSDRLPPDDEPPEEPDDDGPEHDASFDEPEDDRHDDQARTSGDARESVGAGGRSS